MRKVIVLIITVFVFILPFIGCKKTTAPTMPAPPDTMMTVTEIIKISDSARATQTYEAASTSTALAALFTRTSTPTVTITATRTVTATVTCTVTSTPPVYLVYDPLVNASAPDPAKWDVQGGGAESSDHVSSGAMNITAKTSTPGTVVDFNVISKCADGTRAFKGSIVSHSFTSYTAYDYGIFDISIGNTSDGYTLIFHETISGSEFTGGFISFEYQHVSGNTYTYSINGKTPQSIVLTHQPQIKMSLTAFLFSNYVGAYAQSVFKVKDLYYY